MSFNVKCPFCQYRHPLTMGCFEAKRAADAEFAAQSKAKGDPPPWPKDPDGKEKTMGELTKEEAQAQIGWAIKKLVTELESKK